VYEPLHTITDIHRLTVCVCVMFYLHYEEQMSSQLRKVKAEFSYIEQRAAVKMLNEQTNRVA